MWSAIAGIISSILGGEAASGSGGSSTSTQASNATNPAPAPSGFAYTPGAGVDTSASQPTGFKPTKKNPGPWASAFKQEAANFAARTAHDMLGAELDKDLEGTGVSGENLMSLANSLFNMKGGK